MKEKISPEVQIVSELVASTLIDKSARPVFEPEAVNMAISTSLQNEMPLRCRMVLCPNWQVTKSGRLIGEIPVSAVGAELIYHDISIKIIPFLTEEIPELVSYLHRHGMAVELLVILADILSPDWVFDSHEAEKTMRQNLKAVKLLLMSSERGREMFNHPDKGRIRVVSQQLIASKMEKEYPKLFSQLELDSLQFGTEVNQWYLEVIKQLQEMGEYADKRSDVRGLKKIWERALFLSTLYALDGMLFNEDFERAGFPSHDKPQGFMALGAVATPHGDLIARGLNVMREKPIGMVTPFNNAMEHSWSEPRREPMAF